MRLIDADSIRYWREIQCYGHGDFSEDELVSKREIDHLPTITPENLVVHGRWKQSEIPCEKFRCSVCGGAAWYYDVGKNVVKSRYCPNCGAKMDREN